MKAVMKISRKMRLLMLLSALVTVIALSAVACSFKKYTLTINIDGLEQTSRLDAGDVISLPSVPSKTGYAFIGWHGLPADGKMPESNLRLTAVWNVNFYPMNLHIDGMPSGAVSVPYGAAVDLYFPTLVKDGYTLGGWSGLPDSGKMPASSLNLSANWRPDLILDANGGDEILSQTLDSGASIENLPTPSRTNFTFEGWEGMPSDGLMTDKPLTLKAKWRDVSYLSFSLTGNGSAYAVRKLNLDGRQQLIVPSNYMGKPVTVIGDHAFSDCTELTTVTIPLGVIEIADGAFKNCVGITTISIPSSVVSVGTEAFSDCNSLTAVSIPFGVTSIADSVFKGCRSLVSIIIPPSVTSIGNKAFSNCRELTTVTIPPSVTAIGNSVFYSCGRLETVNIPVGVTKIGSEVFSGCGELTAVTIPQGVTSIGDRAFAYCRALTSVIIPSTVTSIGDGAFNSCRELTDVSMSCGVTSIADNLFSGCIKLTTLAIPFGVERIGESAFSGCDSLTSVSVPSTVTDIGEKAFSGCDSLTNISIHSGVTGIGEWAFAYCRGLTTIVIPSSVLRIGENAFYECGGLTDVYFEGTDESAWAQIGASSGLEIHLIRYYSKTPKTGCWYYGVDGKPLKWRSE